MQSTYKKEILKQRAIKREQLQIKIALIVGSLLVATYIIIRLTILN